MTSPVIECSECAVQFTDAQVAETVLRDREGQDRVLGEEKMSIKAVHVLPKVFLETRRAYCGIRPGPFFAYEDVVFYPTSFEIPFCKNCKRTRAWKKLLREKWLS